MTATLTDTRTVINGADHDVKHAFRLDDDFWVPANAVSLCGNFVNEEHRPLNPRGSYCEDCVRIVQQNPTLNLIS